MLERHEMFRLHIGSVMWHELAQLDPGKPFSDVIEGLFGTVFIDSNGDLTQCESNTIGVFSSLHRMTRNGINAVHLKTRLAELLLGEKVTRKFRGGAESGIEKWCAS